MHVVIRLVPVAIALGATVLVVIFLIMSADAGLHAFLPDLSSPPALRGQL
jgi:hypothetical protein